MKKILSFILIVSVCVCCNATFGLAGTKTESDYTTGGSGGSTLITYRFRCVASYTSTLDACVIDMWASSTNTVEFGYGPMTTTRKDGEIVRTTTAYTYTDSMNYNSKTWIVYTGLAGANQYTTVESLMGGKINVFGYKYFYNVAASY